MSDQAWAILGGIAMVIVLRVLDYYLPRGYASRRVRRRAYRVRNHDNNDNDEDELTCS